MGGVLYTGFKWSHHDNRAGYHNVVKDAEDYVDSGSIWGGKHPIGTFPRKLNIVLAELLTIARALRYQAVFYIYPEVSALFFSAPLLKVMGKRVIYAQHRGEKYWDRSGSLFFKLKRYNLKFVNHFIVLSTQQKSILEKHFPGKVSVIPHGIWLDSGIKLPVANGPPRLCVSGDNFRNYELLREIIERFSVRFPQVGFDLIGMRYEKLGKTAEIPTVTCHPRLSPEEYAHIIGCSIFMLLPLHFATANNALLEALALGVPVLCNRIDGVTDYLPSDAYLFDSVEQLCNMTEERLAMSTKQRAAEAALIIAHVEQHYSWSVIRKRIDMLCLTGQIEC